MNNTKREDSRRLELEELARTVAVQLKNRNVNGVFSLVYGRRHGRSDPTFEQSFLDELAFELSDGALDAPFEDDADNHFFFASTRNAGGRPDLADLVHALRMRWGSADRHLVASYGALFALSGRDVEHYFAALERANAGYQRRYGSESQLDLRSPKSLAHELKVDLELARAAVFPGGYEGYHLLRSLRKEQNRTENVAQALHRCTSLDGLILGFRFVSDEQPSVDACASNVFAALSPAHRAESERFLVDALRDALPAAHAGCFEALLCKQEETEGPNPIRRVVDYLDRVVAAYANGEASSNWLLSALDHYTTGAAANAVTSYVTQDSELPNGRDDVLANAAGRARSEKDARVEAALEDLVRSGTSRSDLRLAAEVDARLAALEALPPAERLASWPFNELFRTLAHSSDRQRSALRTNTPELDARLRALGTVSEALLRELHLHRRGGALGGEGYRIGWWSARAYALMAANALRSAPEDAVLYALAALGTRLDQLSTRGLEMLERSGPIGRMLDLAFRSNSDDALEPYSIVDALLYPGDDALLRDALLFYLSTAIAYRNALANAATSETRHHLERSFRAAQERLTIAAGGRATGEVEAVHVFMARVVEESGRTVTAGLGESIPVYGPIDRAAKHALVREASLAER